MEYRVFDSASDASDYCADAMIALLNDRIRKGYSPAVAVSGGNTPKLLFETLLRKYGDTFDWTKAHFFWVDERCVPTENPESNYGAAADILFGKIAIPTGNLHRISGEADPETGAALYTEELLGFFNPGSQIPVFDLVLLGMGDDGHTASIFPGNMELLSSDRICDSSSHPVTGQKRITLTGTVINNASQVWFLVTGRGKAPVIKEIFNRSGNWMNYPASFIVPVNGNLFWILDAEASGELTD